jgi:hypothetical protein
MDKYRINPSQGLEFGIYTLGDHLMNPKTGTRLSAKERVNYPPLTTLTGCLKWGLLG